MVPPVGKFGALAKSRHAHLDLQGAKAYQPCISRKVHGCEGGSGDLWRVPVNIEGPRATVNLAPSQSAQVNGGLWREANNPAVRWLPYVAGIMKGRGFLPGPSTW